MPNFACGKFLVPSGIKTTLLSIKNGVELGVRIPRVYYNVSADVISSLHYRTSTACVYIQKQMDAGIKQ